MSNTLGTPIDTWEIRRDVRTGAMDIEFNTVDGRYLLATFDDSQARDLRLALTRMIRANATGAAYQHERHGYRFDERLRRDLAKAQARAAAIRQGKP